MGVSEGADTRVQFNELRHRINSGVGIGVGVGGPVFGPHPTRFIGPWTWDKMHATLVCAA